MKKHFSQLTAAEIDVVRQSVKGTLSFSPHAEESMQKRNIRLDEVVQAVQDGTVIEVHNDIPRDVRGLFRRNLNGRAVCAVVSLKTHKVITVWTNAIHDNHSTLDTSVYNWVGSVIPAIKGA